MNTTQQQYLQALGIERWERRDKPASLKLMLISETILTERAKKLLNNMFNTIGLTENDLHFTSILTDLAQQMSGINPGLCILLDNQLTSSMQDLRNKNPSCVIIPHPEYLLKNPLEKKKAYADLQLIQKKLAL